MLGEKIVKDILEELKARQESEMGYDNYVYPDAGDSYDNADADDSDTENA